MLTRDKLLEMFRKSNALQRGHFELSSGLHSGHYFQCAQVLQYPTQAMAICRELARRFRTAKPTVVVGPAAGGIVVSYETARALGARAIYSERVDAEMQLRRGFTVTKKDRVLIVEDAITTGESARKRLRRVTTHRAPTSTTTANGPAISRVRSIAMTRARGFSRGLDG